MKETSITIFFIFFFIISIDYSFCQDLELTLKSVNPEESIILENIEYKKLHQSRKGIKDENQKISEYLKKEGFFFNRIDSVINKKNKFLSYFFLGLQTKETVIVLPKDFELKDSFNSVKNDSLYIMTSKISKFLEEVSKKLDEEGRSFSKVFLSNIFIKDNILFSNLKIEQSEKRVIDKIVIKPYNDFPSSFLKNYLRLNQNTQISKDELARVSLNVNQLNFVTQIKPPEVLFTKDSTILYLYAKKKSANSFDGIINFVTEENGGINLNGNINLSLNNVFNKGESLKLIYNGVTNQLQDLNVFTEIPYLFNSKFSTSISFNIFKQDSTFLNTNFNSKLKYELNTRNNVSFSYNTISSSQLSEIIQENIQDYTTTFFGIGYSYMVSEPFLNSDKFNLFTNLGFGNRNSQENTSQIKFDLNSSYLIELNTRNNIFLKANIGILNSDNLFTNELYRIGGANSIRGFDEQSIFTSQYYYLNSEYRFKTNKDSYLFSVTDIGNFKNMESTNFDFLYGIGLGYSFFSGNNNFKISYVIGNFENESFTIENSKIIINWITYF